MCISQLNVILAYLQALYCSNSSMVGFSFSFRWVAASRPVFRMRGYFRGRPLRRFPPVAGAVVVVLVGRDNETFADITFVFFLSP